MEQNKKISNKELKKLAKDVYSCNIKINELPTAITHGVCGEEVKKALLDMFESGYRYGEAGVIKKEI